MSSPSRTAALLLSTCLAGSIVGPARSEGRAPELQPYQMVRSLQHVQDRVAAGDHAALPIQRRLLELVDKRLRTATASELMQPTNLQSMLVYAMSGGNPETLESILLRLHLGEKDSLIAAAILGYLNGATRNAAAALKTIEPMQEPRETGAFLALLKGSLVSLEDPQSALKLMDQARLLAPGTLVEEAALRRSVGLAAAVGAHDRFILASKQYSIAYIRSPYASQFADSVVSGVIKLYPKLDMAAFDGVTALMRSEQRKVIYLRIARRAAIEGVVELANLAAERARKLEEAEQSGQDPRLLLYTALTDVTAESAEALRSKLAGIDQSSLSAGDRKLMDAVLAVADQISVSPAAPAAGHSRVGRMETASDDGPGAAAGETPAAAGEAELIPETPEVVEALEKKSAETRRSDPESDRTGAPPVQKVKAASAAPTIQQRRETPDPIDDAVLDGRRRLAEIDELLAGAAK
jgi:chemotaxis protein MotC